MSVPGLTAARQPAAIPEAAATFLPEERAQGAAAAVGYPKAAPAACCQLGSRWAEQSWTAIFREPKARVAGRAGALLKALERKL